MAISATLTAYNAPYGLDMTQTRRYLHGLLAWAAGTYAAGGILPSYATILDASGQAVMLDRLNLAPDTLWLQSISGSGYTYVYIKSTGKIMIMVSAGATPAGTISIPVDTNVGTTGPVFADTVANHFSTTGAATTITNATFTGTAIAAGPMVELANGALPAAVVSDIIEFEAEWVKA